MLEPHDSIIRIPKQTIYNYITMKAWKYNQLINKMSSHKIKE